MSTRSAVDVEVAVVGAGVVGCATALALARRRVTVALLEAEAARSDLRHLVGSHVTIADICLVPQIYNARRFECDLQPYPRLNAISAHLEGLPAFVRAAPEAQTDAV